MTVRIQKSVELIYNIFKKDLKKKTIREHVIYTEAYKGHLNNSLLFILHIFSVKFTPFSVKFELFLYNILLSWVVWRVLLYALSAFYHADSLVDIAFR